MLRFFKHCSYALLFALATHSHAAEMQLQIEGLTAALEENVRASLDWQGLNTDDLSAAYLQARLDKSNATVKKALEPFGYYQAQVSSELIGPAPQWRARYVVRSGPQTLVRQLNIAIKGEAAADSHFATVRDQFPLQIGDALDHPLYESGKTALSKQLNAKGYLDSQLTQASIRVNRSQNSADIDLIWSSGRAYHFGELRSESGEIDSRLIQRWAKFQAGDRFNYETLLSFQRQLDSSGFFQRSEIAVDRDSSQGLANITVITEPAAKRLYRGSLGYGTDTGARSQLGFEQRWLNRFGHSLRAGARLAEREQSYSLSYKVPALRGRADSYSYGWQRRDQQLPEYDSRSDRFSAVQLSNTRSWQILWGLNFEADHFTVGGQRQSEQLWYIENQWSKYRSNKAVYPDQASSLIVNGRLGAGFDSQQKYFSRLHIQQLWIRPSPWPEYWPGRFIFRAAAGALWSDSFAQLPPQHRFYSGGDRNVRGYAYQSLSPTDGNNNRIGGRYLTEASIELDYRINDSWAAAIFTDAGQAFDNRNSDIAIGVGLGARFITSLLVVRMDVANAVNQDRQPWRLHLTLGTDF